MQKELKKRVCSLVAGGSAGILLVVGFLYLFSSGALSTKEKNRRRANAQPIPFSHRLHAGKLEMNCLSCHTGAGDSDVARLPSVKKCIDCHSAQKNWSEVAAVSPENASTDSDGLGTLLWYWQEKKQIPWKKIHDLPEHVQFEHDRHVRVGVSCQTCHGTVKQMKTAKKVKELDMKSCVSCHMESKVVNFRSGPGKTGSSNGYKPGNPRERIRGGKPATWRGTNPHKNEIQQLLKTHNLEKKNVSFDCVTCHR